jgi:enterobacterial common antigen flippase
LLLLFSGYISILTFGTDSHAAAVGLLSLAVAFRLVSAGQGALIQGMRRIPDLAMLGILGAVFGTVITIPAVYLLREDGVVPSLVGAAGATLITSWWYSRRVRIHTPVVTAGELRQETGGLVRLGLAFMASGLMVVGSAYMIRVALLRTLGFEAAGLYQAAWAVGGLYVGFILQAMGTDFYPRLTAVARDNHACNRMVNEQAQVSLLLAGPGVIATLTFAPFVISMMYSVEFHPAVPLLRWICGGMALRVITWPMGFIILAKGEQTLFFVTDLAWTLAHVGLAWVCVESLGLNGAGIAFFGSYIFHGFIIYPLVRSISGFRWSADNSRTSLFFIGLIVLVSFGFFLLRPLVATLIGGLAVVLSAMYSIRILFTLVGPHELPRSMRSLAVLFRFEPRSRSGEDR